MSCRRHRAGFPGILLEVSSWYNPSDGRPRGLGGQREEAQAATSAVVPLLWPGIYSGK